MVIQPQAGIPDGCPDIIALCDGGGWLALELKHEYPYKRDGTAKKGMFQPLQLPTLEKLGKMYHSAIVWPENWPEVKAELENII